MGVVVWSVGTKGVPSLGSGIDAHERMTGKERERGREEETVHSGQHPSPEYIEQETTKGPRIVSRSCIICNSFTQNPFT